jgi:DNA polymerase-3 subunit delta
MAIYFFYGKEEFLISKQVNKLREELVEDAFKSMNYRIYSSPPFDDLLEICATAPLMFGNILSVVHCEKYFFRIGNKKLEFSDKQLKDFEFALSNIVDSNNIVFVCNVSRDDDKKIDTRTKLFKLLTKVSNSKEFPQYRNFDKELQTQIVSLAKEKDLRLDNSVILHLIERLGVNLRLIDSELTKLKTAVYPQQKVSNKDIDEYCSLTENVFELADLLVETDKNSVMKQFNAVIEKTHPLQIIALLHINLRKLIYIKTYEKEKTSQMLSKELFIPEYPVKKLMEKVRDKSLQELLKIKHNLCEAEVKMKTGQTQNLKYLLESVFLG